MTDSSTMVKALAGAGMGIAVFLAGGTAAAQPAGLSEFGNQGQFILSADRLVPVFAFTSQKEDVGGLPANTTGSTTSTQTSLSFFWGNNGGVISGSVFDVPRVGFDYVVVSHLTIGGDIAAFFTLGGHTTDHVESNGVSTDTTTSNPSQQAFGIAPRIGYVFGLSPAISFWLRGGVSYYLVQQKTTDSTANPVTTTTDKGDTFAFDFDPQFVFAPVPHFAITVGPALDIGFGGHVTTDTTTNGATQSSSLGFMPINFAVAVGLLGWLGH
ncbi:MAG TPA: hypothetical protein VIY73_00150 [Polyangiaceae bacterium]